MFGTAGSRCQGGFPYCLTGGLLPLRAAAPPTNTLMPVSQPTPDPFKNVQAYQVGPGETLSEIALKFGVSVEEIMAFNGLKDASSLGSGQVIFIPENPLTAPTQTPEPPASATPTSVTPDGTPVEPQVSASVAINAVIGASDLNAEHVFVTRTGSGELSLAGWQLVDEDGNVYTFPQLVLFEGGAVNVWTSSGSPTVIDLYWGLAQPVWRPGEKATLRDDQGTIRATFTVP